MTLATKLASKKHPITADAVSLIIIFTCYVFPTFPREVGKSKVRVAYDC